MPFSCARPASVILSCDRYRFFSRGSGRSRRRGNVRRHFYPCYRGNKAIALAHYRLNVFRVFSGILQAQSNLANCGIDPLFGVEEDVLAPQPRNDFFTAD